MKSYVTVILLSIAIFACDTKESANKLEDDSEVVINDDELKSDSTINEILSAFNDIQDNLTEIKIREGLIQVNSNEVKEGNQTEQIIEDIKLLNNLMLENEKKFAEINQRLNNSQAKNTEFRRLISNLNKQLEEKNQAIYSLNEALKKKQLKIDELYFQLDSSKYVVSSLRGELKLKEDELSKAYFAFGSSEELLKQNVISKEGGFLGLGKSKNLKNQFNENYFTEIDVRKQKAFLIYAKKAEVVTNHPKNSYQLMGDENQVDSLIITDAEEFWKASKYLVIVTD